MKTQTTLQSPNKPIDYYWRLAKYCLIIGACLLVIPQPALAQDISLVVSPPITDLTINPGETVQKTIKVTNTNTTDLILDAQVIDYIVQDDTGTPIKVTQDASGRFLASTWFQLDQSELSIAPNESAILTVIITAPKNALPGGHYSGIYFEPKEKKGSSRTVSYTAAQVGSLFAITVAGDVKYDALIKDFNIKSYLNEFGPIDFNLTVENQSDTHITPTTQITITDMFGRNLDTLKLDTVNIFPYTARHLSARWNQTWGFGRYQARATITYSTGLTTSRDLYFWILPYRLILAVLVILLLILASFISVRRHLLHRNDTRDAEIDELKRKIAQMENENR